MVADPYDPVGMGSPRRVFDMEKKKYVVNPSDFEQSDEYADQYEEEERLRQVIRENTLRNKILKATQKITWTKLAKLLGSAALVLIPLYWILYGIFVGLTSDPWFIDIMVGLILIVANYALAALIGVVIFGITKLPALWRWIWED